MGNAFFPVPQQLRPTSSHLSTPDFATIGITERPLPGGFPIRKESIQDSGCSSTPGRWFPRSLPPLFESNLLNVTAGTVMSYQGLTTMATWMAKTHRAGQVRISPPLRDKHLRECLVCLLAPDGMAYKGRAQSLSCCAGLILKGDRFGTGRRCNCRQTKHCPRCARYDRSEHLSRLRTKAESEGLELHMLTLSIMNPILGMAGNTPLHMIWDAANKTLKRLVEMGVILGGVRRFEIALSELDIAKEAFWIRPHLHAVVLSRGAVAQEVVEEVFIEHLFHAQRATENRTSKRLRRGSAMSRRIEPHEREILRKVVPDVQVLSIDPTDGLDNRYWYLRKPISVIEEDGAYGAAAGRIERSGLPYDQERKAFYALNRLTAEAFEFITLAQTRPVWSSPTLLCFGCMNRQFGRRRSTVSGSPSDVEPGNVGSQPEAAACEVSAIPKSAELSVAIDAPPHPPNPFRVVLVRMAPRAAASLSVPRGAMSPGDLKTSPTPSSSRQVDVGHSTG